MAASRGASITLPFPSAFAGTVAMLGRPVSPSGRASSSRSRSAPTWPRPRRLNASLHAVFGEADVFRIDHFLGKESIENILALRFANGLFEPIWNRDHVDHVQIDVPETLTVAGRSLRADRRVSRHGRDASLPGARLHRHGAAPLPSPRRPCATRPQGVRLDEASRSVERREGQYEGIGTKRASTPSRRRRRSSRSRSRSTTGAGGVPFFLRTGKSLAQSCQVITLAFHEPPLRMFRLRPTGLRRHVRTRGSSSVPGSRIDLRELPRQEAGAGRRAARGRDAVRLRQRIRAARAGATSASCTTRCSVTRPCSRAATASSGSGTSPDLAGSADARRTSLGLGAGRSTS